MTKLPTIVLVTVVSVLLLVLIGCSAISNPMFVVDEDEADHICPEDYITSIRAHDKPQDQASDIEEEPIQKITDITHPDYIPPSNCHKFFREDSEPVWYGRVLNLHPENQALYIYGHSDDELILHYDIYVRGGPGYKLTGKSEETVQVYADDIFMAGYVPYLEYDMYDVAIHVKNGDQIDNIENLDFKLVYVGKEYTMVQISLRLTYCLLACVVFMCYLTKLICRVPAASRGYVTQEQKQLLWLNLALIFFNDPFYAISILQPSKASFIVSSVFLAFFVAGILNFWLAVNLKISTPIQDPDQPEEPQIDSCAQKIRSQFSFGGKYMKVKLAIIFMAIAVSIFMMSLLQLSESQIKPSFSIGRGDDRKGPVVLLILIVAAVLILYYAVYFLSMLINCKEICKKDKATKLIFSVNQFVHLLFISAMFGGVYSHAYALGGIQIFFYGLSNLYIYVLIFLAWPLKVRRSDQQNQAADFTDVAQVPQGETDRKMTGVDSGRRQGAVAFEMEM